MVCAVIIEDSFFGFADIAKPLHRPSLKGVPFARTSGCSQAFEKPKNCLCEAPTLAHPDFTKEFILDTDASDFAIDAVLSQVFDGKERVIAYASKTLTKSERKDLRLKRKGCVESQNG